MMVCQFHVRVGWLQFEQDQEKKAYKRQKKVVEEEHQHTGNTLKSGLIKVRWLCMWVQLWRGLAWCTCSLGMLQRYKIHTFTFLVLRVEELRHSK
jgi:hypothetical protein